MRRRDLSQIEHRNDYSSDTPTRMQVAVWGALLVATIILSLQDYQAYQLGTHYDDARYVILTQSLIHSDRYGMINVPGQPGSAPYPFGYPLLLTPFGLLFPDNLDALKVLSLIATVLNATLLFWGWRWFSRRSYWWAIAVVGLHALSPLVIDHTRRVMSEPIFTTFCLAAMLLAEQAARGKQNRGWSLLMSVALTFVVFTRTIGVVLVISVFAYLLFVIGRRFWKELLLIVTTMIVLVGLVVGITPVNPKSLLPSNYFNTKEASFLVGLGVITTSVDPSDLPSSRYTTEDETPTGRGRFDIKLLLTDYFIAGTKQHLGEDLRQAILPLGGGPREQIVAERIGIPSLPILVGVFTFGLIVLGYFRWFVQEGLSVFNLYAILYSGALFLWVWKGPRLLYPIQAQLHFGFLLGIEAVLSWAAAFRGRTNSVRKFRNGVLASAVFILLLLSVRSSLKIDDSRLHTGDLQARTTWLKANTTPCDIIMTGAPPIDFMYSGRKTVYQPGSLASTGELEDYLAKHGVDYILIAPRIEWQPSYIPSYSDRTTGLLSLIADLISESRVMLVYSSEQDLVKVFKIQPQK